MKLDADTIAAIETPLGQRYSRMFKVMRAPVMRLDQLATLVGVSPATITMRLHRGLMLTGQPRYAFGRANYFTGFDLVSVDAVESMASQGVPIGPVHAMVEEAVRLRVQTCLTDTGIRQGWALFVHRNRDTGEWATHELYESDKLPEHLTGATLAMSDRRLRARAVQFLAIYQSAAAAIRAANMTRKESNG